MRTTTRHDSGDCRTGNADLFPVTQQRQYRHATVEHLTLASASASAVAAAVQTNRAVATCCPDNADVTSHCPPSFSHIDVTRNSHYNALDWTRGRCLYGFAASHSRLCSGFVAYLFEHIQQKRSCRTRLTSVILFTYFGGNGGHVTW